MELKATLFLKFDTKQITDRFRKREFVVEYADNPQYPQRVLMQVTNDKCSLIDNFNPGDELEMHFDIRGREWQSPQGETKYFNSLEVWRVNPVGAQAGAGQDAPAASAPASGGYNAAPSAPAAPAGPMPGQESGDPGFSDDDLPF